MNNLFTFMRANTLLSAIVGLSLGLILYLASFLYIYPKIVENQTTDEPIRVDCYIDGNLYQLTSKECEEMSKKILTTDVQETLSPTSIKLDKRDLQVTGFISDPVIKCHGAKGSQCESQSILLKRSVCNGGTYVCCNTGNGWSIQEKTICNNLQKGQAISFTSVTLPHNGKQYRCQTGLEDDIYNQSLTIKNLRDRYDQEVIKLNAYDERNCHSGYEDSDTVCQKYVNDSKEDAKKIFLDGSDENEVILDANLSKVCQ